MHGELMRAEFYEEYREGYEAGHAFHMEFSSRFENPYEYDTPQYKAWDDGFTQAGEDS
jgi:predicted transcriptional regulator